MNAQKLGERTGATPGSIAQSIVDLEERLVLLGHDIGAGLNLVAESTQARIAMLDTDLMACGKAYHDLQCNTALSVHHHITKGWRYH